LIFQSAQSFKFLRVILPLSFVSATAAAAMEAEIQATFDNANSFNNKLKDTLSGLLGANNDRKAEIDSLRSDHDGLQKAHDAFQGRRRKRQIGLGHLKRELKNEIAKDICAAATYESNTQKQRITNL
jgi:hypothetical protein